MENQEPNDHRGYGTILFGIFSQIVLWPISLVYILKTYLDVPLPRAILGSAVVVVWMLWLVPSLYFIIGFIAMLIVAWKIFEALDII